MPALFFIVVIIAFVLLGPLLTIWALNTLFPVLNIPYSFDTWVAVVIVGAMLRSNVNVKKD